MSDDDICGAEKNDGDICEFAPSYDDGRCGHHSEHSDVERASKGEARAEKHGLYSEPTMYYERLTDSDKALVDAMYESFLEDAPFDESAVGKCELLWQVAIDIHKRRKANEYISAEGMTEEETVGYEEGYGPLTNTKENTLHIAYDRLGRTNTRILKELGVLDDPDSKKAEAGETLIDLLSGDD